ncbi:hypothetical protein CCHL11_01922 [Colletotrichum chlorophyti]|uniref:Uncharacterized protein n=1 Tax=Colletotrichum chlorophyti TaxID=708187 RepID=A0A1Q8RWE3_9PEZI|nr:hypothetical protein CCHL11_01922 [Colletotrichum chlorophyti]
MSKDEIHHSEEAIGRSGSVGKRKTCMRHCKRFWWLYLIITCLAILLIVLLIIFVGIPRIAQSKLDHVELTVDGITVSNTTPNSYNMAINSTLRSDGKIKATVDGFDGVMYLEDLEPHTPFVNLRFPETRSVKLQTVNVSQPIQIENMEAFTTFNKWLQANESVRVTIKGDTHVKVPGISKKFGVVFRNTITLKGKPDAGLTFIFVTVVVFVMLTKVQGLNHFNGIEVTENTISLTPDARGDNFKGWVNIPNHSVLTLEIGNTTFSNMLNGEDIGTVYIDNLVLHPGINNVSMRANISQAPVLTAIQGRPYCENGILPFALRGKDVSNHGQKLSYFTDALSAGEVITEIDIGSSLKKSLNLTVSCTGLGQ